MTFIKVKDAVGDNVLINLDKVTRIEPVKNGNGEASLVYFDGGDYKMVDVTIKGWHDELTYLATVSNGSTHFAVM